MNKAYILMGLFFGAFLSGCATSSSESVAINQSTVSSEGALQAYTTLGLQYLQTGDSVNAKSAVQKALDINPTYAPAFNALGLIFQVEGEIPLAEQYYKKAIEQEPASAMFHNNYGAFLFSEKRYQEACVELAKATEDPFYNSRSQAFENLGRCYQEVGRNDVAIHAFERSLKTGGVRPLALVELSDIYLTAGNVLKAEEYFSQFTDMVNSKRVNHSSKSLWVGIRLARENSKVSLATTYTLLLKNMYPESDEYMQYKESVR